MRLKCLARCPVLRQCSQMVPVRSSSSSSALIIISCIFLSWSTRGHEAHSRDGMELHFPARSPDIVLQMRTGLNKDVKDRQFLKKSHSWAVQRIHAETGLLPRL